MFKIARLAFLATLLVFSQVVYAQFDTAAVLGTIRDASRAVVPSAQVTLTNIKTGIVVTAETDGSGNYQLLNVPSGSYTVKAEKQGFKAAVAEQITVTVGARQRVDLTLEVGGVTENVVVNGAASVLEIDTSDRGQVVASNTIINLPLNGRNYADLALLVPGVRRSAIPDRESSFNVNGMRSALNNFMVDGMDNNSYATSNQGYSNQVLQLSPDAVSEFKVVTNNYSAEYGRAGGAIINASVKSGTNEFHGAVWEYLRNTSLNAVGFFKPAAGKPVLQQNQFGGSFGGPIRKNKTFVFGDVELLRRVDKSLSIISLPSMDQRAGTFGTPIVNPYTGVVYSNGIVPAAQITPFAKKVFDQLPTPQRSGQSSNYDALPRRPTHDTKGDIRVDHYFSKATAFFRYSHREYNQIDSPVIPLPIGADNSQGNVHIVNKQGTGGLTYTLSPTSLLEFRMAIGKSIGAKYPLQIGLPNMQDAYGIPGLPTDSTIAGGITTQSIGGFQGMGRRGSTPQFQNPLVINPKLNYSLVMRAHTLKMGWEYQNIHTDILDFSPQYGQDSYSGQFTRPSTAASNNLYNAADFLFGARSRYALTNVVSVNYRQRMNFFYLQDDWKVNAKLTLNLGARYDYATPQWEAENRLSSFDPANKALIFAKDGGIYDRALVNPDRNNFAPRLGLAYSITPKTVLRGGYGISYIHFNRLGGENMLSYNLPTVISVGIDQRPSNPLCAANVGNQNCFRTTAMGYPAGMTSLPSTLDTINNRTNYTPPNNRTGYVQSWHLSVQRQLPGDLVMEVAYVGNHGVKLMILGDYNQPLPNATGKNLTIQQRRPLQTFGEVQQSWSGGSSIYHGLQVKLEKRFSGGFYLLNSFAWSHSIDNAPGHLEVYNGDNSRVNFYNVPSNKGNGAYNQPINNTTTLLYDAPIGKGRRFGANLPGVLDAIVGGWGLMLINTMSSGQNINLTYAPTSAFTQGSPTLRPSISGSIYPTGGAQTYLNFFDKNTISLPTDAALPFGNAGRNIARGYPFYQADFGLHKSFRLWKEATRLEIRGEFFNVLNKTNFGIPNSDRQSSSFGRITSTFPARVVQVAARITF